MVHIPNINDMKSTVIKRQIGILSLYINIVGWAILKVDLRNDLKVGIDYTETVNPGTDKIVTLLDYLHDAWLEASGVKRQDTLILTQCIRVYLW